MNKKDLPIELLQGLNRLNVQIRNLANSKSNLIDENYNSENLILFTDKDIDSYFKFEIKKVELAENSPMFTIEMAPCSTKSNELKTFRTREKIVIELFGSWLSWLNVYEKSALTPEEKRIKEYENEYYLDFEIIEDEADESFNEQTQIALYQKLELLEENISSVTPTSNEVEGILTQITELKYNLTSLNKQQTVKSLSRIFAKIRKAGIQFLKVAEKEVYKRIVNGGLDQILEITTNT